MDLIPACAVRPDGAIAAPTYPVGVVPRPVAVFSPHPLLPAQGRRIEYAPLVAGESIHEYLVRTGLFDAIGARPVRVTLNGRRVPRDLWRKVRPRPGVLIGVQALVHGGGGGGKNPISTLLSLAMFVFPPSGIFLSAATAATSIIGRLTVGMVFNAAFGLVVNALFAPPRPNISQAQQADSGAVSPTYSLSGGGNRGRPWEPLPVICGTHRVFLDLGARPFTEFQGHEQYLYQVFNAGYNTVALSDFKIGATGIAEFQGVETEISGTDGVLDLFPGNVDTIAGADVSTYTGVPIIRTTSPNCTAFALDFTGQCYQVNSNGQVVQQNQTYEIQYRAVGSPTWIDIDDPDPVIRNASRDTVRRTFRQTVAEGQYEVSVLKTTPDDTGINIVYSISWSALRSYQPDTGDYTGQQRMALKIRASGQLSGQVEQFSAIARAQCPVWNGAAWVDGETSNPAWWFRAIALGRYVTLDGVSRRVWGAGLAAARVDDDSLKAWGAWCDLKALTFNAVFDRAMSAHDMLQAIATAGRASMSWASGKLGVVYDIADQPVTAVFGMSNIEAGSFSISYQTEQLADEVVVSFINPDLDWSRDSVRCLVPGTITPTRTRSIELFGCTSLDMAGRAGNLYAAQNAYRTRQYKWRSDFEAMTVARGDVVALSHDLTTYDYSGRLIEGSTASVLVLERAVPLQPSGAWIIIIKPDQSFATYAVAPATGTSATVTLASALPFNPAADPDHPVYDYKFLYGATATPGRLVKIADIRPVDESTVELTAIDELEVFYAAENGDYIYNPPRANYGAVHVSNLTITETGVSVPPGYMVQLSVTWDAENDYAGAELFAAIDDGPEISRGTTTGRRIDFVVPDGAVVTLRLVATSTLGRLSRTVTLEATHTVTYADNFAPADVTTFLISGDTLSWLPVSDVDVAGYKVRFNYGTNADWSAAAELHRGVLTASPWTMSVRPAGQVTLMIKAIDVAGIESATPAVIYTDLGDPVVARVIETIDLDALGYPGTTTGGSLSVGDLVADSGTLFWPTDAAQAFWGADSATYWPTTTYSAMVYQASVTPRLALDGSIMTIDATVAAQLYTIEYRPNGPGVFWPADSGAVFWGTASDPFWPDPPDYQPWPGALNAENEPYDIRISTSAGSTQGVISALTVSIDAPFVEESLNDVVISAGGTRLAPTKTYRSIDNVQITVQADGNGAVGARIEDKDATLGPLIKTINDAGTAVAGLVDARIRGY